MIAVIGLGYVGLPLAISFAQAGKRVVGFDIDADAVRTLSEGHSHILDVSHTDLQQSITSGLTFSSDPSELIACNVFIICVPTPLSSSGSPDISHIVHAVEMVAPHVQRGSLVVLESTSHPGTTEEIVAARLSDLTGLAAGLDFCVAFSPERVDPGNNQYGLNNTPKIVAGLQDCCRDSAALLYKEVVSEVVIAQGLGEAELSKLLENTYRQVNIALMNEMVKFCRDMDIDLYESIRLASTKPFGFQPFFPGPGVGGHCIPIDPQILAARVEDRLGYSFRFVNLAQEINLGMPAYAVDRLSDELEKRDCTLSAARVLVLGVTYKRDVPDMRESPAEEVIRLLLARGAHVEIHDPHLSEWSVDGYALTMITDLSSTHRSFDASILLTDHTDFDALDIHAFAPFCLDTRGRLVGPGIIGL